MSVCDTGLMSSTIIESTSVEQRAALFSALSDPIRLRILDELAGGKTCVCTLQETIEIAPNLLSYHLGVLRKAHLVIPSRRGRWVDYTVSPTAPDAMRTALPINPAADSAS